MTPMLGIMASQISGHLTPPSSFYSIATVTAAGGETSLSFTSIPGTYKSLHVRGILKDTTTADGNYTYAPYWLINSETQSSSHGVIGTGASAIATGASVANGSNMYFGLLPSGASYTNIYSVVMFDIVDYASTTKLKTIRQISAGDANGVGTTNRGISLNSALFSTTSAVTSLTVNPGYTSFAAGTTFALYGIKG